MDQGELFWVVQKVSDLISDLHNFSKYREIFHNSFSGQLYLVNISRLLKTPINSSRSSAATHFRRGEIFLCCKFIVDCIVSVRVKIAQCSMHQSKERTHSICRLRRIS